MLILTLILALPFSGAGAFSGAGPFSHKVITERALEEYGRISGRRLSSTCAQMLIQSAIQSDKRKLADNDANHCDNSNISGCAILLDHYITRANQSPLTPDAFSNMGKALHIVQDFYSHSNWVEQHKYSMELAPLESYKFFPPPGELQSGIFPDLYSPLPEQLSCYLSSPSEWSAHMPFATHGCMGKDSNYTFRGGQPVLESGPQTLHELAGQYAILHTVELLKSFYAGNHHFQICTAGEVFGCRLF